VRLWLVGCSSSNRLSEPISTAAFDKPIIVNCKVWIEVFDFSLFPMRLLSSGGMLNPLFSCYQGIRGLRIGYLSVQIPNLFCGGSPAQFCHISNCLLSQLFSKHAVLQ